MTVYCEDCTHATQRHPDKLYRWLCMASPVEPKEGFIRKNVLSGPPYKKCETVNKDGNCQLYEKLKRISDETGSD